jgi:hypothetical protein
MKIPGYRWREIKPALLVKPYMFLYKRDISELILNRVTYLYMTTEAAV